MTHRSLLLLTAVVFVTISAVVAAVLLHRGPQLQISTAAVTAGRISRQIIATGTLTPVRTVQVGTQVSGTIASLSADFNSIVHAGEVIARLDPAVYRAMLDEARGKLEQTQAEWNQLKVVADDAGVKFARAKELASQDLIPQSELDTARIAMQQAAANLKAKGADVTAARGLVNQAEVNLDHTVIRSPINGIVINRAVDEGQTVAATLQSPVLFEIADLREMQVLVDISEADVGGVQPGARASFQVESLGSQTFEASVADVRLQPTVAQAASATATPGGTGGVATTPTSGQPSSTGATGTGPGASAAGAQGTLGTSGSTAPGSQGATSATSNAASAASSASGSGSPTRVGVVSYTAVIAVDNRGGVLTPGSTALVTLTAAQRRDVVRLPNNALTFRPSAGVLEAVNQEEPKLDRGGPSDAPEEDRRGRVAYVWKFEKERFVPIEVVTGLADDGWTELISGPVRPGDVLVTAASVPGRTAPGTSPLTPPRRPGRR